MGDELTNAALIALIGTFGLALILRGSGSVAAFFSGTPQPTAGPASGLGVLFNPADPAGALDAKGLNPVVYWIVTTLLLAALIVGVAWMWILLRRHNRKTETDPHRLAGIATTHEVKTTASAKALLRRAGTLRPSLTTPTPADVGYLLGASRGTGVWASVEDSILLIGPPRSGKTLHVVVNAILDAPGAVVTTSTRPENLTATLRARRRHGGPVAVFDPQHLAEGIPAGLRWSPVRGCQDPLTAMIRATGMPSSRAREPSEALRVATATTFPASAAWWMSRRIPSSVLSWRLPSGAWTTTAQVGAASTRPQTAATSSVLSTVTTEATSSPGGGSSNPPIAGPGSSIATPPPRFPAGVSL